MHPRALQNPRLGSVSTDFQRQETGMDTPDPLRYHKHYQDSGPKSSSYAGGSSFMEQVSERVASGMGTVGFLVISSTVKAG